LDISLFPKKYIFYNNTSLVPFLESEKESGEEIEEVNNFCLKSEVDLRKWMY